MACTSCTEEDEEDVEDRVVFQLGKVRDFFGETRVRVDDWISMEGRLVRIGLVSSSFFGESGARSLALRAVCRARMGSAAASAISTCFVSRFKIDCSRRCASDIRCGESDMFTTARSSHSQPRIDRLSKFVPLKSLLQRNDFDLTVVYRR